MPVYKNCQGVPCEPELDIREWIAQNPIPHGTYQDYLRWLAEFNRAYACSCGCGEQQTIEILQEINNFLQGLSCPERPLPVQDCLSEQILQQLQQINENTDELEITAQNINLNANQINLNTDQVEALLNSILNKLNATCANPLSTRVCNPDEISNPITVALGALLTALNQINVNTDQVETLLQTIIDRLNADCTDPLSTQVCNPEEISQPIVNAINNINLTIPPRPALDCNLNPTGDELPGVTVVGVVQNRPCPAPNLNTLGATVGPLSGFTIPANVKSWTAIVFEGSATIQGQPNILAGTTIKGGGYSDGSRVGPISVFANAASRVVVYWEI